MHGIAKLVFEPHHNQKMSPFCRIMDHALDVLGKRARRQQCHVLAGREHGVHEAIAVAVDFAPD